jgi:ankyrin repeat protein
MQLIKLSIFLDQDELPHLLPCQELRRRGLLVSYNPEEHAFVIFVSHQWLGSHHPDPQGLQFEALRRSLGELARGHTVAEDWHDSLFFGSDPDCRFRLDPDATFVWLDWLCIPQVGEGLRVPQRGILCDEAPYSAEDQKKAISSIPYYVKMSHCLLVLAPSARHENGAWVNVATWRRRPWCRLELDCFCWLPRPGRQSQNVLLVRGPGDIVSQKRNRFWMKHEDMDECTCCRLGHLDGAECDLVVIERAFLSYAYQSFGELKATSDPVGWQRFLAMTLQRRGLDVRLEEGRAEGGEFWAWSPLQLAVLGGSSHQVTQLLAAKSDPNQSLPSCTAFPCLSHATALQLAARIGDIPAMRALLEAKADVHQKGRWSCLGFAAFGGHLKAVELLLESQADQQVVDDMGGSALLMAAAQSKAVCRLLLDRRASVHASNDFGALPLHQAAVTSHKDIVDLLLEERADIDAVHVPKTVAATMGFWVASGLSRFQGCGLHLGRNHDLVLYVGGCHLATAAVAVALQGNTEMLLYLVEKRADLQKSNALGFTATLPFEETRSLSL